MCGWEKRFVLLKDRMLSIYLTDDTSCRPQCRIDLSPSHRSPSINLISDIK